MTQVLICGAAIVTVSMGIRHGFGLWLTPLTTDRGWTRETFAFALAVQNLAWGLAGPFAGMLADRYGRKLVFQVSMIFWGLGSLWCALAPDARSLGHARLLLGFGMGMEFPVALAIVAEIVPAAKRGRYMAILEGFWPLGFIAAGLLSLLLLSWFDWRSVFLCQAIPALFVFVVRLYVPESPRWLAARGRHEEAGLIMARIEAAVRRRLGGRELPPPAVTAPPTGPAAVRRFSFLELWTGPYVRRTVMIWLLWFFALLGFYGLTTWLGALLQEAGFSVAKSVSYTILISLAGLPGFAAAAWLIEAWGRKPTCVLMLLGSAAAAYLYGHAASLAQLIGFGLCMQFFLFGMWSALYAYTPELYPTRARATGAGCASAIGRVGSLIGPYLIGVILPAAGHGGVRARRRRVRPRRGQRRHPRRGDQGKSSRGHLALKVPAVCGPEPEGGVGARRHRRRTHSRVVRRE
jgi:putative MFS transporter